MDHITTEPFFNRRHGTYGFELLGASCVCMGAIFMALDALNRIQPSVISWISLTAGLACCCAASVTARRFFPGVVAVTSGLTIGAAYLAAVFAAADPPQILSASLCGVVCVLAGLLARWSTRRGATNASQMAE